MRPAASAPLAWSVVQVEDEEGRVFGRLESKYGATAADFLAAAMAPEPEKASKTAPEL